MQVLGLPGEDSRKWGGLRATGDACRATTKLFLESTIQAFLRFIQRNTTSPLKTLEYHA